MLNPAKLASKEANQREWGLAWQLGCREKKVLPCKNSQQPTAYSPNQPLNQSIKNLY
jgi:hypothetical protein